MTFQRNNPDGLEVSDSTAQVKSTKKRQKARTRTPQRLRSGCSAGAPGAGSRRPTPRSGRRREGTSSFRLADLTADLAIFSSRSGSAWPGNQKEDRERRPRRRGPGRRRDLSERSERNRRRRGGVGGRLIPPLRQRDGVIGSQREHARRGRGGGRGTISCTKRESNPVLATGGRSSHSLWRIRQ